LPGIPVTANKIVDRMFLGYIIGQKVHGVQQQHVGCGGMYGTKASGEELMRIVAKWLVREGTELFGAQVGNVGSGLGRTQLQQC
jgi:hypothetical protein